MVEILDGKKVASKLEEALIKEIKILKEKKVIPNLAIIKIGNACSSEAYFNSLKKKFEKIGLNIQLNNLPDRINKNKLIELLTELSNDKKIHGILVESPLPLEFDKYEIYNSIDPRKDVDGVNVLNARGLNYGGEYFTPCTPKGIISLLEAYKIPIKNKEVVILGRSEIVGMPLLKMMTYLEANVEIYNSRTERLDEKTKKADILISAIGKPYFITKEMIKEKAVVIDVGINYLGKYLVGDVNFDDVKTKASYITPVPGGVGPMTVISLAENLVHAAKMNSK
ncbi:bifunctional 5,10-methylenetetrahydrofolate dehydrogenase/5,10-methenyltetrahydrofolate cyclohydrolase [Candidatus Woesearchaeota archaeon]|nr:bifunctional 5,10-methylenetetrahydrofolate dehydrogenase/5,10-methenyltetrahydrofolate cyclohydrolase [Candidatus Woesearchaeota archaeon]